jgi:hypothetical protein
VARLGHYDASTGAAGIQQAGVTMREAIELLFHELGHPIEMQHLNDARLKALFDSARGDLVELPAAGKQGFERRMYMASGVNELFAETFMHYILHGEMMKQGFPGLAKDQQLWKDIYNYFRDNVFDGTEYVVEDGTLVARAPAVSPEAVRGVTRKLVKVNEAIDAAGKAIEAGGLGKTGASVKKELSAAEDVLRAAAQDVAAMDAASPDDGRVTQLKAAVEAGVIALDQKAEELSMKMAEEAPAGIMERIGNAIKAKIDERRASAAAGKLMGAVEDMVRSAGEDASRLPRQDLKKTAEAVMIAQKGILREGQKVTLVVDGARRVFAGRGADIGVNILDVVMRAPAGAADEKFIDSVRRAAAGGKLPYEVGVKIVKNADGSLSSVISDEAVIEIVDGKVVSSSVTRSYGQGEDVVSSFHLHPGLLGDGVREAAIREVAADAVASLAVEAITGRNVSEYIVQITPDGPVASELSHIINPDGTATFNLSGFGSFGQDGIGVSAGEVSAAVRVGMQRPYSHKSGVDVSERTTEARKFDIKIARRAPAPREEAVREVAEGTKERLLKAIAAGMPPITEEAVPGRMMPVGAMTSALAKEKAAIEGESRLRSIKSMVEYMEALAAIDKQAGIYQGVSVVAFDARSVDATVRDLAATARGSSVVKVVIFGGDADKRMAEDIGAIFIPMTDDKARISELIRKELPTASGNAGLAVGKIAITVTGQAAMASESGSIYNDMQASIAENKRDGRDVPSYIMLHPSITEKDENNGRRGIADLVRSALQKKPAFIGIGEFNRSDFTKMSDLLKKNGGVMWVIRELSKALGEIMSAIRAAAVSA